jgi:hypothetical protein
MLVGRCSSELSTHKFHAQLKKSQPLSVAERTPRARILPRQIGALQPACGRSFLRVVEPRVPHICPILADVGFHECRPQTVQAADGPSRMEFLEANQLHRKYGYGSPTVP